MVSDEPHNTLKQNPFQGFKAKPEAISGGASEPSAAPPASALNKVRLTILVAMMFSLLVAGIFRSPPIVFMASILGVAPPLAILVGRWSSKRILVVRDVPPSGTAGEVIYGRLTITNQSRWPAFLTEVRAGQVSTQPYRLSSPGEPPISAEAGGLHEITLLRPHESVERVQAWRLNRRGVFNLPPVRAASTDPLALFNESKPSGPLNEITVLPRVLRIDRLGFVGGSAARLQAPQHATVVADAMDFHGVRPYQPGEAIRRIHWKSTARTGQLQIVEWEENVARDLAIVLDADKAALAGEDLDNTLETSIIIAASIARHLLEGGYALQLFCWQNSADSKNSTRQLIKHEAHNVLDLPAILHLLARLLPVESTPGSNASLPSLTREAAMHLPPGRATLLLSSTLADLQAARRPLEGREGAPCHILALDATSFGTTTNAPHRPISSTASPADSLPRFDSFTRVVRRGDALTAVLEQMA